MPARVLLDPANPFDFSIAELKGICAVLVNDLGDEVEPVLAVRDERGYGGPLSEVLHVWLDIAESVDAVAFAGSVAISLAGVLRRRWEEDKKSCASDERPRKRCVTIYGPDDRPLLDVEVDAPEGEPVIEVCQENARVAHPRPAPSEGPHR
jgi:hypothetical protein